MLTPFGEHHPREMSEENHLCVPMPFAVAIALCAFGLGAFLAMLSCITGIW